MKLEEAIAILEIEAHLAERQPETRICDALKLGIKSLEERQLARDGGIYNLDLPLPGETKDCCKFCGQAHTGIECPSREGEK